MPKSPTTTTSPGTTAGPAAAAGAGAGSNAEAERVRAAQPAGTERTRERPLYLPRVDIVETGDAIEVLADMPGVTRDGVEVILEQRVLTIRGRTEVAPPEGLALLHLEYEPGDYERAFTLSDAVDPGGIEARVRGGVLHLRLPKAGPAELRRIEVRAD